MHSQRFVIAESDGHRLVTTVHRHEIKVDVDQQIAFRSAPIQDERLFVSGLADFDQAFDVLVREPNGGLLVLPDTFNTVHRAKIIALAARHRVPAVYPQRFYATDGGLMAYGADLGGLLRLAASYVDRILRGARPADLPVQSSSKFELVINLKTAKALGLEVPSLLLARADEVIE